MRKQTAIFLLVIMFLITSVGAINLEGLMKTATVATEIKAVGMPLQELLELLSRSSGIELAAVPEVADLKVDLIVQSKQTVAAVLAELQRKYGLQSKLNAAKTVVVLLKGDYMAERMYAGKGIRLSANDAVRPSVMRPPAGVINPSLPIGWNTEEYKTITDNSFQNVTSSPLSTFSIDVDTASYSNVRRFLNSGNLPPADAVRTEELLNYFSYEYPQPTGEHPISLTAEVGVSPWNSNRKLVMLGLQGKNIKKENLPPSNLVFLIDVSGSMFEANKLPLLKTAFKMLVQQLRAEDRVAIVVYAGAAGLVLESTPGSDKAKIIAKIDGLQAGGSTAGGEGIKLAYNIAQGKFIAGGNNRVILTTDGDFNVGASSEGELVRMIEERRDQGISLTVLGFGMGNIKDNKMEALADKGNGNYAYIDNALEAKKVLVSQMAGTLFTIAKDVKIQVEFNPATVKAYRLIGYENRKLADRDFNDDKKDAGDMGAGHCVTVLYEIVPANSADNVAAVDPLIFQQFQAVGGNELLQVKVRYKNPTEETSLLFTQRVAEQTNLSATPSENFRFAAAVAEYGMLLRNSEFQGQSSYAQALSLARSARGADENGYRAEFIRMLEISQILANRL